MVFVKWAPDGITNSTKRKDFFNVPENLVGGILFFISHMVKLSPNIVAVIRTAAKANSYSELEMAIPFLRFCAVCALLVEAHERAVKQAAVREEARRWRPGEDEILRLGFREGRTVGELADQLGRTPLVVKKRLAALGLLKIADIRRATPGEPPTSVADKGPFEPDGLSVDPEPDEGPEINLAVHSCDSSEDELYDRCGGAGPGPGRG